MSSSRQNNSTRCHEQIDKLQSKWTSWLLNVDKPKKNQTFWHVSSELTCQWVYHMRFYKNMNRFFSSSFDKITCVDFVPNRNVYFICCVNFGAPWYALVKWTYILETMMHIFPSIRQTVSSNFLNIFQLFVINHSDNIFKNKHGHRKNIIEKMFWTFVHVFSLVDF